MALNASDVNAGDDILAAHNNALIDDIQQHNHEGTDTNDDFDHLNIVPGSAVVGLVITQGQNANGITISTSASGAGNRAFYASCKYGMEILQNVTNGFGLVVQRNLAEAGTLSLIRFIENNVLGEKVVLEIQNDGKGKGLYAWRDSAQVNSDPLIHLVEDNAASTQNVVTVQNDGSGAGIEINNTGAGEEIKFTNAVTRELILDPAAFSDPTAPCADHGTAGWSCQLTTNSNAVVNLPLGATVTVVTLYAWCDNVAGVQTLTVELRGANLSVLTNYAMASCTVSWGDAEAASFKNDPDSSITNAVITSGRSYHIRVTAADANIYCKGVRIQYTIAEPLP